jgi:hypothetical protein
VAPVDERRVLGLRGFDERARVLDVDVERDGDDLDALGVQFSAQLLPPGQVEAAASP